MKNICLVLSFFILFSCSEKDNFKIVLTQNNKTSYWIQKAKNDQGQYVFTTNQYVFYEDGTSLNLSSLDEKIKGTPSMVNIESSNEGSWTFDKKDSTFENCAVCIYKITKYSNDTIQMKGKGYTGEFKLIRMKTTQSQVPIKNKR